MREYSKQNTYFRLLRPVCARLGRDEETRKVRAGHGDREARGKRGSVWSGRGGREGGGGVAEVRGEA